MKTSTLPQAMIKHGGSRSRTRAAQKRGIILRWLLRWNIIDRHIVQELLGCSQSTAYATIQAMTDEGLINQFRARGVPIPVIHLTAAGHETAVSLVATTVDATLPEKIYPSRINLKNVQHDLLVQRTVLLYLRQNPSIEVLSAKQMTARNELLCERTKMPDALIIDGDRRLAIEVQQTYEKGDNFERILSTYAQAIAGGEIYGVAYASTSQSLLDFIEDIGRGHVRHWYYNRGGPRGIWMVAENLDDPMSTEIINDRFFWLCLAEHEQSYYTVIAK